jgi:hypothetical protein
MGHRGNYIIKNKGTVEIYYTHWRAIHIAHDLLLGPKEFIKFIRQFQRHDNLIDQSWIEGCVLMDLDNKQLIFWEREKLHHYTLRQSYISYLETKWPLWNISFAEKAMYDLKKYLNIKYTIHQETDLKRAEIGNLTSDNDGNYVTSLMILKRNGHVTLKQLHAHYDAEVALLGPEIVEILSNKNSIQPIKESDADLDDILLIDCDNKLLCVNQNYTGLEGELTKQWLGWTVEIASFGYIQLLRKAGCNTENLKLTKDEIEKHIDGLVNYEDNFDPQRFAQKLLRSGQDIQFNPNYFENIKPRKSMVNNLKAFFARILR